MNLTIIIDSEACVGDGECVVPSVLLGELDEHRARKLCDDCPTAAIRIAS